MHVFTCTTCTTSWFPVKLCCPRCGGRGFEPTPVLAVDVEEVTADPRGERWIATVRTGPGPRLIARVPAGTATGDRLRMVDEPSAVATDGGAFAG